MDFCAKAILFVMVVLVVVVSVLNYKEHFNLDFIKRPNLESCWQHIINSYKWNVDSYEEGEKKVLLTMKKLNANSYEDDNKFFPGWNDACVIPKEHIPIYNRDPNDTQNWDLYNPDRPDPNSQGFMRWTKINEHPDGYVVDLNKHDEKSFQRFLNTAWQIYDKEFLDEKKRLEAERDRWKAIRDQKRAELQKIKDDIAWNVNEYNKLLDPNSECQRDRVTLEQLIAEFGTLQDINNKLNDTIKQYTDAYNFQQDQVDKFQKDYNDFAGDAPNTSPAPAPPPRTSSGGGKSTQQQQQPQCKYYDTGLNWAPITTEAKGVEVCSKFCSKKGKNLPLTTFNNSGIYDKFHKANTHGEEYNFRHINSYELMCKCCDK